MEGWILFLGFILLNALLYIRITHLIDEEFGLHKHPLGHDYGRQHYYAKEFINKIKYLGMHLRISK
ncbi:hypothetical protein SAMN05216356_11754 [Oribacterium sp. WCC10]|nr:hypothetical protein SAMN05216356_11754 [Oribacterium sp. WCC10]